MRQAQAWAQQALGELQQQAQRAPIPFQMEHGIMTAGESIRFAQEVNLAIKQHNEREQLMKQQTWDAQVAQSKKPGGVVTIPDYVANIIPWRLRRQQLGDGSTAIWIDYPKGTGNRGGKMDALMARLFPPKVEQYQAPEDPFEKWLGNKTTQGGSGVDEPTGT